ncbi:MAG TPA: LamG-like jellyroll fold domain-containing protein, partial [Candidatus Binatia bacterium]|nr:LamG-like jellyroll fold domain-containing protein [Candidatus Binatia bacterium]
PDLYSHNDFYLRSSTFWDQVFGQYGMGLAFNGTDQYALRQTGFPTYKTSGYSISMWVNAVGTNQSDRRFFAESSTNNNTPLVTFGTHTTGVDGTVRVFIRNDANATLVARQSTRTALDGTWHHVVWTDTNGNGRLYIDGVLDESDFTYTPGAAMTLDQTAIGAIVRAAVTSFFTGGLDEVAVWSRVLSLTEIQEIREQGIPGPAGVIPPSIIDQPVSQSVLTRSHVTLSFAASGTSPLSIQWRKGTQDMDGQTNSTLNFPSITLGDAGQYSAVVENSAGRATTDVATITVALRPDPPTDLRVDFNNTGEESQSTIEPGFESFTIPQPALGPFKRTYGGADLTVSGINVNLESRRRAAPVNTGAFTEEKLLQDFVFARDAALGDGMDLAIEFLEPSIPYDIAIWSYDRESATARISDWSANGTLMVQGYAMVNTDLPTDNFQKQIRFTADSDASGKILIEGRRSASASAAINVFVNALRVSKRHLRVTGLQVLEFDTRITFEALRAGTTHRLEEKSSLTDAQWTEVPDVSFTGNGSTIEALFATPVDDHHFYRIIETP